MKIAIKLLLLASIIIYLIIAFTNFTKSDTTICRNVNFTIADSSHAGFITSDEADRLLHESGLYPVGKQMEQIDMLAIERALKKNNFIDSVSCYRSPNGTVNVLIEQRLPLMRIMANNGEQYYLDSKGNMMSPQGYVADLVVATGNISHRFAQKDLTQIGRFLRDDPFWDGQIEQINVVNNNHLQLVPRIGSHIIEFGNTDSISQKFRNLYTFYEKVLPKVGWNKYSKISVEHITQIVAKKEKR